MELIIMVIMELIIEINLFKDKCLVYNKYKYVK